MHASPSYAWTVQQGLVVKFEVVRHMVQEGHNLAVGTPPVPWSIPFYYEREIASRSR